MHGNIISDSMDGNILPDTMYGNVLPELADGSDLPAFNASCISNILSTLESSSGDEEDFEDGKYYILHL